MSHKATNWLSDLEPDLMGHSEFRVLFHLCDCHNPSAGCFPTQAYLMAAAGLANSTLNAALKLMEGKGLIRRHRSIDGRTKRQRPTRYILGFEIEKPQDPTPDTGDGIPPDPTPDTGDGADSDLPPDPTPISGESRLRLAGDEPVSKPVKNLRAHARGGNSRTVDEKSQTIRPSENPMVRQDAERAVQAFRDGRRDAFDDLPCFIKSFIVTARLMPPDDLLAAGLSALKIKQEARQ